MVEAFLILKKLSVVHNRCFRGTAAFPTRNAISACPLDPRATMFERAPAAKFYLSNTPACFAVVGASWELHLQVLQKPCPYVKFFIGTNEVHESPRDDRRALCNP